VKEKRKKVWVLPAFSVVARGYNYVEDADVMRALTIDKRTIAPKRK